MGERKSVRFENHQLDAAESMSEDGVADNQNEAIRMALNSGLAKYGYVDGHRTGSPGVSAILLEIARVSAYSALAYASVAVFFSTSVMLYWVLLLLGTSLGCLAVHGYVDAHDINVGARVRGLFGRGEEA